MGILSAVSTLGTATALGARMLSVETTSTMGLNTHRPCATAADRCTSLPLVTTTTTAATAMRSAERTEVPQRLKVLRHMACDNNKVCSN